VAGLPKIAEIAQKLPRIADPPESISNTGDLWQFWEFQDADCQMLTASRGIPSLLNGNPILCRGGP
jgi:hypothetical protein